MDSGFWSISYIFNITIKYRNYRPCLRKPRLWYSNGVGGGNIISKSGNITCIL